MRTTANRTPQGRMEQNLAKSVEIVNAVFALKLAWMRSRHPEFTLEEAECQVGKEMLRRKDRQWTSAAD